MKITPDELKQAYAKMSDEELLSMKGQDLTDVARQCYEEEVRRRGVEALDHSAAATAAAPGEEGGAWVSAGTFRFIDEAQIVLALLQSAGVPSELDNDSGDLLWLGTAAYTTSRVLVPEQFLEDAHALIESRAAEEEMAAQAGAEPPAVAIVARYEDGVFKPLDPVEWEEGTEVEVRLLPQH